MAIAVLFGLTFALFLVKAVALGLWTRRLVQQLAREESELGSRLFDRYLRRPFLQERSKIELRHNLDFASRQLFSQMMFPGLLMFSEIVVLVAIGLFLLIETPVVTVALGIWTVAISMYFRSSVAQRGRSAGMQTRKTARRMSRTSHDAFNELVSIRLQARERFFVERFRRESMRHSHALATDKFYQQLPKYLTETLFAGSLFVWFIALLGTGLSQIAIVSTLTLYASAALRCLPALQRCISQFHIAIVNSVELSVVLQDLEAKIEMALPERPAGRLPRAIGHSIALRDVTIAYAAGAPVLRDISLSIRAGEKVAVGGATGSGKTTLLNIMLGLLSPGGGEVLIDGARIDVLAHFRTSSAAYVPQEVYLLDGTVAENVAFGVDAETIDRARARHVLEIVRLTDRLGKDGLDSKVGENGFVLSGGERQRLGLARALYEQPTLLVLDEATSQLDPVTEAAILDRLLDFRDMTLVFVTHRAGIMHRFDRCIRLRDGRLEEIARAAA
jgi:ABC-type multidrug transport system fused ATPase/permease subunit